MLRNNDIKNNDRCRPHRHQVCVCVYVLPTDTDYISEEEKQKVELMLAFLTEESKQAAASTAVSVT